VQFGGRIDDIDDIDDRAVGGKGIIDDMDARRLG
jgi:hypothetical protein